MIEPQANEWEDRMWKLIKFQILLGLPVILASCTGMMTNERRELQPMNQVTSKNTLLFEDSMKENWQKNWFLDGENAILEHRDGGLAFITEYKVDKRVDRAGFDAQHAVLWTRQEFEGDIRISYTFTKLPGCSWQKLIYVQAQGIGTPPYVKDIYAWRDLRKVASMNKYFNYMNLIALSLRDQIRCKRYPWYDVSKNVRLESEFLPRGENKGMAIGHRLHCVVEKRKKSITLRIKDLETGEFVVDHTWDLTQHLEGREPKFVEKGRIGIRLMGGHKILIRDFRVERLSE
ncbi:MAG: hypothetical protein D6820_05155 [Lentisphaerae bacterium]|nr:MAG: hypothetical protein D6820_05155 [Lentisphaerota bacterium]